MDNPLDPSPHKPPAKKIRLQQFNQAGAVLKEMVLMENDSCPLSEKSAGGNGRPELCGWQGGGELASVTCLYSTHELKGDGGKYETYSPKPLMGEVRTTPSSKIEEGLQQSTPRSKESKETAPAESTAPAEEAQAAPAEPAGMEAEEFTAEGIGETVIQKDITTGDVDGLVLRDTADQKCLRPVKLLVEPLGTPPH